MLSGAAAPPTPPGRPRGYFEEVGKAMTAALCIAEFDLSIFRNL
jgi:hypothetical protein